MSRRSRRKIPTEPVDLLISDLSHDGRGVAELDGKKIFIHGALPGERVRARLTARMRRFDAAEVLEVLSPSAQRVIPRCPHFGLCGGCALQHMDAGAQIAAKQDALLQNLERIGKVKPQQVLEPLTGPHWNYRRKARLSVRYVYKKERLLIGFRERGGKYVADISECHVLDHRVAELLMPLTDLIAPMDAREQIPQIEVACGDNACSLVVRHLEPLSHSDEEAFRVFARDHDIAILLQAGGPATVRALEPAHLQLEFSIPEYNINLEFDPLDFIQVNTELNRKMVHHALSLLELGPTDRVLDLFCGLGNFTLPMARLAKSVVGVEGDMALVEKARRNAQRNELDNVNFYKADLFTEEQNLPWMRQDYDKILIDPPRSGAQEILPWIAGSTAQSVVYVSCHPASLARDAGSLVNEYGFVLKSAGVMDMFPHTGHVESIAVFERVK